MVFIKVSFDRFDIGRYVFYKKKNGISVRSYMGHLRPCSALPFICYIMKAQTAIISSPGRSPGRAIVLPPALALALAAAALAKSLTLKFFM